MVNRMHRRSNRGLIAHEINLQEAFVHGCLDKPGDPGHYVLDMNNDLVWIEPGQVDPPEHELAPLEEEEDDETLEDLMALWPGIGLNDDFLPTMSAPTSPTMAPILPSSPIMPPSTATTTPEPTRCSSPVQPGTATPIGPLAHTATIRQRESSPLPLPSPKRARHEVEIVEVKDDVMEDTPTQGEEA